MNKEILEKIAQFSDIAISSISSLQNQISKLEKAATQKELNKEDFENAVEKAANALYDADFINSRYELKDFIKKANIDPSFLASVVTKICEYKDVSGLGKISSITSSKDGDIDPIMVRAGLYYSNSRSLFED